MYNKLTQKFFIRFIVALAIPINASASLTLSPLKTYCQTKSRSILQPKSQKTAYISPIPLKLWLVNSFRAHILKGESLLRVHYSPNGNNLVTSASDSLVKLWTFSGKPIRELRTDNPAMLFNANFSRNGKMIITAGYDGTARVWSITGQKIQEFRGHSSAITDAIFTPNGKLVITSSDDGSVKIRTLAGKKIANLLFPGVIRNLAVSSNGHLIAGTLDLGNIILISPSGVILGQIETGQGRLNQVVFSPDGQQILTAGFDGTARVWTVTGKPLVVLKVLHKGWVNAAEFSPNGQQIATVSDDGVLRVWDSSGNLIDSFKPNGLRLSSVSFRPNGKQLVATSYEGKLWIFNLER